LKDNYTNLSIFLLLGSLKEKFNHTANLTVKMLFPFAVCISTRRYILKTYNINQIPREALCRTQYDTALNIPSNFRVPVDNKQTFCVW
jgi:hypothetical protein